MQKVKGMVCGARRDFGGGCRLGVGRGRSMGCQQLVHLLGVKVMSYNTYLREYHRMLDLGYSGREATHIAYEAAFEDMLMFKRHAGAGYYNQSCPDCDICGEYKAVTISNGWFVCSEVCLYHAREREKGNRA